MNNEVFQITKSLPSQTPVARLEGSASGTPDEGELELINRHSRRKLSAGEVFVFSVVLCDNEIDRDFERFTIDALHALSGLFVGKSGIFDHSMKGRDQLARIFHCEVEAVSGRITAAGEPYHCLKARAYIPRISKNEEIILEIDAGIKKEVSVGCAVSGSCCSVCGVGKKSGGCAHVPGREYTCEGKSMLCHTLLENPTDAFEWSFVAVPAQRDAGVVKSFAAQDLPEAQSVQSGCAEDPCSGSGVCKSECAPPCGPEVSQPQKSVQDTGECEPEPEAVKKSLAQDAQLTKAEKSALLRYVGTLEKLAGDAYKYREFLCGDIVRLSALCSPELPDGALTRIVGGMEVSELENLRGAYRAAVEKMLSPAAQLPASSPEEMSGNRKFMI